MVWLALDVSVADENIWLDELIANVVAQDNWQDLILDRIPTGERPTIINLPPTDATHRQQADDES